MPKKNKTETKLPLIDLVNKVDYEGGIYETFVDYGLDLDNYDIPEKYEDLIGKVEELVHLAEDLENIKGDIEAILEDIRGDHPEDESDA